MRVLYAALALVACGAPPEAAAPPSPPISISLDSVTVADAARELATATGRVLVVDPRAEIYAACAHVSVTTPSPAPAADVIALVRTALRSSGFTIDEQPTGLVLGHDGWTRPSGCTPPRRSRDEEEDEDDGELDDGVIATGEVDPALATAVRRISDTEWEMTRAYRDSGDASLLSRGTRMLPDVRDDVVVGLRLFGVRSGTLISEIGFENGDVLREVNGLALTRLDTMASTYESLRDADEYTVLLDRRGEARTHVIHIVESLGP